MGSAPGKVPGLHLLTECSADGTIPCSAHSQGPGSRQETRARTRPLGIEKEKFRMCVFWFLLREPACPGCSGSDWVRPRPCPQRVAPIDPCALALRRVCCQSKSYRVESRLLLPPLNCRKRELRDAGACVPTSRHPLERPCLPLGGVEAPYLLVSRARGGSRLAPVMFPGYSPLALRRKGIVWSTIHRRLPGSFARGPGTRCNGFWREQRGRFESGQGIPSHPRATALLPPVAADAFVDFEAPPVHTGERMLASGCDPRRWLGTGVLPGRRQPFGAKQWSGRSLVEAGSHRSGDSTISWDSSQGGGSPPGPWR